MINRTCPHCGESNPLDRIFCQKCNKGLLPAPPTKGPNYAPRKESMNRKDNNNPRDPLGIGRLLFIVFIVLVFAILIGVVLSVL